MVAIMMITVSSDVMTCGLINRYPCSGGTCCLHLNLMMKGVVPLKCYYLSTRLHVITSQKKVIITDIVRTMIVIN